MRLSAHATESMDSSTQAWMTVQEFADALGIERKYALKTMNDGIIPYEFIDGGMCVLRIDVEDIFGMNRGDCGGVSEPGR